MNAASLRLLTLDIRHEHDVVLCRQRARQLAAALGFDMQGQTRIATAVSEIVRNAFDYARGGKVGFSVETAPRKGNSARKEASGQTLVATVHDTGPGIPPVGQRRSQGGLGLGLSGAERLVDAMEIASRPGATSITLRNHFPKGSPVFSAPQLQAVVDRLMAEPSTSPLGELQRQNQELLRVLDQVNAHQADVARINQELAATNAGVLALYDELETLHRVGILLASQLDLKTLLQAIIDATTDLTGAHFGAFFYREESRGGWRVHATAGPARAVLERLPAVHDPDFFGETFGTEPEEEPHVSSCRESKFAQTLGREFALQSCLTIPVSNDSGTLGALVFGSAEPQAFTERSERIVASIAATAVVGIEKAQLFERVQSASAAKDQFLAMVSHELRTPLNPVLAVVSNWVEEGRVPPDMQEEVAIVLRNVRLEARLIDDLLDFSRIISGKLELQHEALDVHALIRSVVEICAEDIAAGAHEVTLELDSPRATLRGDSARLQQVFWNVLKNAVKFTPPRGRILIKTSLEEGGIIDVQVADTGVGIEAETLTHIFNAFEQGGMHTTTRFGGLGLGLAITKAFVELHGGSVRADSAGVGAGTQVHIRLPLLGQESVVTAPVPGQAAPAVGEVAAATILLVDDHADTLDIMSRLLTRRGYRVLTAGSCAAALVAARTGSFDLIISDLGLPDGSGLTLLASLRQVHDVPAVALSGYGMEEDVTKSRAAGFNEHLTKPIDFPQLLRTVGRLFSSGGVVG